MKPVRTALIGCGKVGGLHARALTTRPESTLVAVCDSSSERAELFAARYGGRAFHDVGQMIRESGAEAVFVCTPHPLHAEPAVLAAQAGIHVMVEKPMAANLSDCDAMLRAAQKSGVTLSVMSQRRFYEPVQRIKAKNTLFSSATNTSMNRSFGCRDGSTPTTFTGSVLFSSLMLPRLFQEKGRLQDP